MSRKAAISRVSPSSAGSSSSSASAVGKARPRFGEALLDAALGLIERARLRQPLGHLPLMLGQARGARHSTAEVAARQASRRSRSVLHRSFDARCAPHRTASLAPSRRPASASRHLDLEGGQAVALGKPLGRSARRIGGGGEAVPAPHVALAADKPLARLQLRLQRLAEVRG